ncbi:dihydrofolate reductase family protein [Endozoicomonas elysicola]|uniref:Diacylglycerol kinase n=1 Tax=Endozoicomonas elysicola TaxID=305900 RepID=A0A081KBW3_9GAMM|nr:dihydrofolate reductase family protein [Endozoicomonas elysicola]KEI71639.1 diacylglycerol kinase [Endozoicomonas elysicola]
MSNRVYIATSLDGFIADKNGGLDWLHSIPNPDGSDFGFADFMETVDALVMGRNTFETVLSFDGDWPYSKPVYVASNSLEVVPAGFDDKASLIQGTPEEIISVLNARGLKNLYIDGGATIQQFLQYDLIDEMTITTVPILLGEGIPLFARLEQSLTFEHQKTEVLLGSLVKSHYRRVRV